MANQKTCIWKRIQQRADAHRVIGILEQYRHPGGLLDPLGHAVTAIGVIGTGFGIMIDNPVHFEKVHHFFNIQLLVMIGADDK